MGSFAILNKFFFAYMKISDVADDQLQSMLSCLEHQLCDRYQIGPTEK